MAALDERIECFIDVLDSHPKQRALARNGITPVELIEAVIAEFSEEIPYLGKNAASYKVCRRDNGRVLDLDVAIPLEKQVGAGSHLALMEVERKQPPKTKLLSTPFYLRETKHGYVYKIQWLPAFIGRTDPSMSDNEVVAVDLHNLTTGMAVSRRHVRFFERDGIIYLELCSRNPVTLVRSDGSKEELGERPLVLKQGDALKLERSRISLQALFQPALADS